MSCVFLNNDSLSNFFHSLHDFLRNFNEPNLIDHIRIQIS